MPRIKHHTFFCRHQCGSDDPGRYTTQVAISTQLSGERSQSILLYQTRIFFLTEDFHFHFSCFSVATIKSRCHSYATLAKTCPSTVTLVPTAILRMTLVQDFKFVFTTAPLFWVGFFSEFSPTCNLEEEQGMA